jgi:hemolysin activation/secretion protein
MVAAITKADESTLPPVKSDDTQLSSAAKVFVKKFRTEGNTVFSEKDLAPILSLYENREITAEELQEVKNKTTRFYIDNGYVTSGVVIPDQKMEDGIITLKIIEGRLTQINVSGNSWLRSGYVKKRVDLAAGDDPLNINTLQDRLKLIKQDPRIENINANLSPGLKPGESRLDVEIQEARPYHLSMRFNNHNSPGIGAYRGEFEFSHLNLSGFGDSLTAQYDITEGLDDYSVEYSLPFTRRDTTLTLKIERADAVVVAEPFNELNIESQTKTYSAAVRQPFFRSLAREIAAELKLEKRESQTRMLMFKEDGYAFSEGVPENGETTVTVLRFSQEWVERSLNQVIAARSTFSFGLDLSSPTINETGPDGRFFTWLGQFQWLRRFGFLESQALFRTDFRYSNTPLLPVEKFSIGGASTVRGYRENQLTTDNGIVSSLEWRVPMMKLKMPWVSKRENDGEFQLCPFFDFGKGWNTDRPDPEPSDIYSIGIGARWAVNKDIRAEIYWGKALRSITVSDEHDIQDDGIHFQVSADVF